MQEKVFFKLQHKLQKETSYFLLHFEQHFLKVIKAYLYFNFLMTEKWNQMRDYSGVYHHLDLFIASIR